MVYDFLLSYTYMYTSIALDTRRFAQAYRPSEIELPALGSKSQVEG